VSVITTPRRGLALSVGKTILILGTLSFVMAENVLAMMCEFCVCINYMLIAKIQGCLYNAYCMYMYFTIHVHNAHMSDDTSNALHVRPSVKKSFVVDYRSAGSQELCLLMYLTDSL
jgi:hypothetical protein